MQPSLLLWAGVLLCSQVLARGGSADYEVIGVASNATSVTITWKIPNELADREWGVVYRRSTESTAHMRLVAAPKGDSNQLTRKLEVGGLTPGTAYLLCVAYGRSDGTVAVEPRKCVGASTSLPGIRSVLTSVGGAPDPASLTIAWRLEAPALRKGGGGAYRHEWAVRIRKAEGDKFTDIPVYDITSHDETDGQSYEFDVSELQPRVLYEVCLVDVEHVLVEGWDKSEEGEDKRTSCAFARTNGNPVLQGAEIAAIVVCAVGAALALAAIAWRRRMRKREEEDEAEHGGAPPPLPVAIETEEEGKRANPYQAAWHTVRLPCASQWRPRPEFRSFRTGYSYGDILTSVTIYGSGYSEC